MNSKNVNIVYSESEPSAEDVWCHKVNGEVVYQVWSSTGWTTVATNSLDARFETLDNKIDKVPAQIQATLSKVATSGDYNDLANKLIYSKTETTLQSTTLGATQVDFDWDVAPILGALYFVTISVDGVDSTLQSKAVAGSSGTIVIDYPQNGMFIYSPNSEFEGHNGRFMGNDTVESVEISGEVIYPLDEKFIPELGGVMFKIDGTDLKVSLDKGTNWLTVSVS